MHAHSENQRHFVVFALPTPNEKARTLLSEAGFNEAKSSLFLETVNRRYEVGTTKDPNKNGPEITLIPVFDPFRRMTEEDFLDKMLEDIKRSLIDFARVDVIEVFYSNLGFPNCKKFKDKVGALFIELNSLDNSSRSFELVWGED